MKRQRLGQPEVDSFDQYILAMGSIGNLSHLVSSGSVPNEGVAVIGQALPGDGYNAALYALQDRSLQVLPQDNAPLTDGSGSVAKTWIMPKSLTRGDITRMPRVVLSEGTVCALAALAVGSSPSEYYSAAIPGRLTMWPAILHPRHPNSPPDIEPDAEEAFTVGESSGTVAPLRTDRLEVLHSGVLRSASAAPDMYFGYYAATALDAHRILVGLGELVAFNPAVTEREGWSAGAFWRFKDAHYEGTESLVQNLIGTGDMRPATT